MKAHPVLRSAHGATLSIALAFSVISLLPTEVHAQRFQREQIHVDGKRVQGIVDLKTGLVRRLVNAKRQGLRLGGAFEHLRDGDKAIVEERARDFLKNRTALVRLDESQLGTARVARYGDMWAITFRQQYRGVPVLGTQIGLSTDREGRVVTFGAIGYRNINLSVVPSLSPREAVVSARRANPGLQTEPINVPKLFILPLERLSGFNHALVWRFMMWEVSEGVVQETEFAVDAQTGEILRVIESGKSFVHDPLKTRISDRRDVRPFFDSMPGTRRTEFPMATTGNISFNRYSSLNTFTTTGLPGAQVHVDGGPAMYADAAGTFTFPSGQHVLRFVLATQFAKARSAGSPSIDFEKTYPDDEGGTPDLHWDDLSPFPDGGTATQANAVILATEMHDWFKASPFQYSLWDEQMPILNAPNLEWEAQAFPSERLVLGLHSSKFPDIVYHEYTHLMMFRLFGGRFAEDSLECLHYASQACGLDEAFADYFAAAKQNDPIVGEGTNSTPRDLTNTLTLSAFDPDNNSAQFNGQILSGAAWDLRTESDVHQALNEIMGDRSPWNQTVDWLHYLALALPPVPTTYQHYALHFIDAVDASGTGEPFSKIVKEFCDRDIYCPPDAEISVDNSAGEPPACG